MPRRAEILAIGSELVSGQSLDTNSQWLSRELACVGIPVAFHTTLGDQLDDHVAAFRIAAGRAELVIMTGGLGPTQDDLTREALAATAGVSLSGRSRIARGHPGDVRPPEPADGRAQQGSGTLPRRGRAFAKPGRHGARYLDGAGTDNLCRACRASPPRCG